MMSTKAIERHTKPAILLHWFNAVCWFFLLATGIGLIDNPELQPVSMTWVKWMHGLFGGGDRLLWVHSICGITWASVCSILGLIFFRSTTFPFIKEIFSFSFKDDLLWLVKKGIQMILGWKVLERLGFEAKLPDQGFYNAGQKLFAIPAVLGGALIFVTGLLMFVSKMISGYFVWVQWSILIHFLTVGLVFAGLLIHIFMAAIARGEFPAFVSMLTGTVPAHYAEHHHKLWYQTLKNQGRH